MDSPGLCAGPTSHCRVPFHPHSLASSLQITFKDITAQPANWEPSTPRSPSHGFDLTQEPQLKSSWPSPRLAWPPPSPRETLLRGSSLSLLFPQQVALPWRDAWSWKMPKTSVGRAQAATLSDQIQVEKSCPKPARSSLQSQGLSLLSPTSPGNKATAPNAPTSPTLACSSGRGLSSLGFFP